MFLPLKADFPLPRFPIITVIVCLICVAVFAKQQSDWHEFNHAITRFCNADRSHIETIVYDRIAASKHAAECEMIFYSISNDPERDAETVIREFATDMKPLTGFSQSDSVLYVSQFLKDEARRYDNFVPKDPDSGLAYYTGSWNPLTMITSNFAHGDWGHIIFNLVFFFAFAATVEVLIGYLWYLGFFIANSVFIGVTGSLAAAAVANHYSTIGLSGIVMGMMGLFAFLLPRGRIKCFYFFIVLFGTIAIPGWLLAAWYIGGDIVALFIDDDHGVVNVMAHVMGGLGGYLFGLLFLRGVRSDAEFVQDDLDRAARDARLR